MNWGIYKDLLRFKEILDTIPWNVSGNISLQEKHVGQSVNLYDHVLEFSREQNQRDIDIEIDI